MNFKVHLSENQSLNLGHNAKHYLSVKREDLIHPYISGNKYRKLKYNVAQAKEERRSTLLTFGGAFSNHIAAVAAVGKEFGFETIGVIRGEELVDNIANNPTLQFAKSCGMKFKFVTREAYRNKISEEFIQNLKSEYADFYLIPEGGTNDLAIKGCEEILLEEDSKFDYICCSVGTGGTISGLINTCRPHQQILGFPALKGDFLREEISKFAKNPNWQLITDYHFGGYAKINKEFIGFINQFKSDYNIPLDPIYIGKMMYGVMDLLSKGYFPEASKILVIHTGGLQGISRMNELLKKKKWPLIS
ncbi:1-aminocyclopropane-1-carboxylate deaminase/D-cysteine desulfhydrase [Gelidibacter maritimus]|uniref:1-aminocyclopropane-1-carboxylate deaminase/D-cysteine desulfhydrase n=1 Tax=Gelidibacter maritimus TaxID=2761487 RepID=A0A7W2M7B9_9FLAO|nr:pyridoxal-phosphate dependent enzyme [Gelidibacter maritimus]MBA6154066.1 1-aminocyclopropane-1-carboxylate deaminase/D-cysteine desulfhydrase [Gelidibacter maritimus]